MITPGEQAELLIRERADLLAELHEAVRWKLSDWLVPLLVGLTGAAVMLRFPTLAWLAITIVFGYVVIDAIVLTRALRERHRRVKVLVARYEMLLTWMARYE